MELHDYQDVLTFENEHQLSKEALKMDVLIIKKSKDVQITKNFGRIFRTHNVFEYKSETDSLSVSDYTKVLGYALLYSSFEQIPLSDITVSFVLTRHPRELIKYLESERQLTVEDMQTGLYYVKGDIFPIQILERRKLSPEDNLFLRNLGSNLTTQELSTTVNICKAQGILNKNNVYLDRILEANKMKIKELIRMGYAEQVFLEAAREYGWIEEARAEGRAEAEAQTARTIAKNMLKRQRPIEEIIEDTGLTRKEILSIENK